MTQTTVTVGETRVVTQCFLEWTICANVVIRLTDFHSRFKVLTKCLIKSNRKSLFVVGHLVNSADITRERNKVPLEISSCLFNLYLTVSKNSVVSYSMCIYFLFEFEEIWPRIFQKVIYIKCKGNIRVLLFRALNVGFYVDVPQMSLFQTINTSRLQRSESNFRKLVIQIV